MTDSNTALDLLTDALKRCRSEDMRTDEVLAALEGFDGDQIKEEARWQLLNASSNGMKRALKRARRTRTGTRGRRLWGHEAT